MALPRIAAEGATHESGGMKLSRTLRGVVGIYVVAAAAYLALDLYGVTSAVGWSWIVLPAVLAQALALTVVVGTWVNALVYFEEEDAAPAPAPA